MNWIREIWRQVRVDYQEAEAVSTGKIGRFEWGVFLVAALSLMVMNFGGTSTMFLMVAERVDIISDNYWELAHLVFWVVACVLGYVVTPLLYLKMTNQEIGKYYLKAPSDLSYFKPYLLFLIPTSLLVVWVSFWQDFQLIYPFYSLAGRSWFDLICWELAYGVQFFALEFFFRGFLLESLRKAFGYGAIAFMIIPYCMIHFPKTAAESLGSVVAGLILGYLAMKTRSIWGGVFLHWLIAIEMDVLSLIQKGQLPKL